MKRDESSSTAAAAAAVRACHFIYDSAQVLRRTRRFAARRGEPILTVFDPREIAAPVCALGYELVEQVSGQELRARYFAGRTDDLDPMSAGPARPWNDP